jgi:ABC-type amino acid transport substrate-binding protein
VVKKGKREELIDLFNDGLTELREKGIYAKTLTYWNLIDAAILMPNSEATAQKE